jgi:hypothetical protein
MQEKGPNRKEWAFFRLSGRLGNMAMAIIIIIIIIIIY